MPQEQREVGVRELREELADILNEVSVRGQVVYVTSRGRRIAAIVPLPAGEQVASDLDA